MTANILPTSQKLATLNALRTANGKSALKSWKESAAKLDAAIAALTPQIVKTVDLVPAKKTSLAKASAILGTMMPKKTKMKPAKPGAVDRAKKSKDTKERNGTTVRTNEFTDWCRANNVNPKIARARLRKAKVAKVNGHYNMTAKVQEIAKGKA